MSCPLVSCEHWGLDVKVSRRLLLTDPRYPLCLALGMKMPTVQNVTYACRVWLMGVFALVLCGCTCSAEAGARDSCFSKPKHVLRAVQILRVTPGRFEEACFLVSCLKFE